MDIECPDQRTIFVDHGECRNAEFLEHVDSFDSQCVGADGFAACLDDVTHGRLVNVGAGVECAPQVAVGEDGERSIVIVNNGRHAQAFRCHFDEPVTQADVR